MMKWGVLNMPKVMPKITVISKRRLQLSEAFAASHIPGAGGTGDFFDGGGQACGIAPHSVPLVVSPQWLSSLPDYILLDSGNSTTGWGSHLLFTAPRHVIQALTPDDVPRALAEIDRWSRRTWTAGYLRYEAAAALLPQRCRRRLRQSRPQGPLVWFGVYDSPLPVAGIVSRCDFSVPVSLRAGMPYRRYADAMRTIKSFIRMGETYQVNFTFDFLFKAGCSAEFLYFLLRRKQMTPFGAAIRNTQERILSFSPELFFERRESRIRTCPMKGTAARGINEEEDARIQNALCRDVKNRAENLMIVDLLRNDLGRICRSGSVNVPSLFDIETHPTVHQMTSRIEGHLRDGIGYAEILKSLFPCGSVTGAPKIRTMEIIDSLEEGPRGVYCGAIGYTSPQGRGVFSVPIRTLQQTSGRTDWIYRAGSGVVWDSGVRSEWREVQVKTAFLTAQPVPEFQLLETMLWDGGAIVFEQQHLSRLRQSARQLGFQYHRQNVAEILTRIKAGISASPRMIRLLLAKDGTVCYEQHEIQPDQPPAVVRIARMCVDRHNVMLRHKTTYRPWYEQTLSRIRKRELWDEIFLNQDGEICEGARSSVFLRLADGCLYTPPLSSGLLPGILRRNLLEQGECREKRLCRQDLESATAVYCGNSVRGLVQVSVRRE